MSKKRVLNSLEKTKLLGVWKQMKGRCNNLNNKDYMYYGYRGIKVSEDFKHFNDFYDWAIEKGYKLGLTLDRIDNEKDYSKENCRFVTMEEQNRNRRAKDIKLNIGGSKQTLLKWFYDSGKPYEEYLEFRSDTNKLEALYNMLGEKYNESFYIYVRNPRTNGFKSYRIKYKENSTEHEKMEEVLNAMQSNLQLAKKYNSKIQWKIDTNIYNEYEIYINIWL